MVLLIGLSGSARWEGQKAGWRPGAWMPEDLCAGLTSTPEPEPVLGLVLVATPVLTTNSHHFSCPTVSQDL